MRPIRTALDEEMRKVEISPSKWASRINGKLNPGEQTVWPSRVNGWLLGKSKPPSRMLRLIVEILLEEGHQTSSEEIRRKDGHPKSERRGPAPSKRTPPETFARLLDAWISPEKTLAQFGREVGLSRTLVFDWKKRGVPIEHSAKVASVLGVPESSLLESPVSVLVIEDEPALLDQFKKGLELAGYRVHGAESAEQAEAELATKPADAIVLNSVPGAAKVVGRYRSEHPDVGVVRITGDPLNSEPDALAKPFRLAELVERVRKALRKR